MQTPAVALLAISMALFVLFFLSSNAGAFQEETTEDDSEKTTKKPAHQLNKVTWRYVNRAFHYGLLQFMGRFPF